MQKLLLKDIADIQLGFQSRKKTEESLKCHYLIIMGKDISDDNEINFDSLIKIEPEVDPGRYLLSMGDVLFMAKGSYNRAACVKTELHNTLASNSFYVLKLRKNTIEPWYLSWWLNQTVAQEYFTQKQSSGATISFISAEVLRNTPVHIPDLHTQKKIENLYETYRVWKERTQELVKLHEQLIKDVIFKNLNQEEKA